MIINQKIIFENGNFKIEFWESEMHDDYMFLVNDGDFSEVVGLNRNLFLNSIENTRWEGRFRDNYFDDIDVESSKKLVFILFTCFTEDYERNYTDPTNFTVGLGDKTRRYFSILKYLKEKLDIPKLDTVYFHYKDVKKAFEDVFEYKVEHSGELLQDYTVQVIIVSPDDNLNLDMNEKLVNSVGDFMLAMGFSYKAKEEPIYGSIIQVFTFIKKNVTKSKIIKMIGFGKKAIETTVVGVPSAEVTAKLATSAADLIKATESYKDVAIRAGQLLIIKTTDGNGDADLKVETISPELANLFNNNPGILNKPKELFSKIIELQGLDEQRDIKKIG